MKTYNETVTSWDEYRTLMFQEITNKINDSRNSSYIIQGYNFLDTQLVLFYDDCAEVMEFKFYPRLNQMTVKIYYCKDWESRSDGSLKFKQITDKLDEILIPEDEVIKE